MVAFVSKPVAIGLLHSFVQERHHRQHSGRSVSFIELCRPPLIIGQFGLPDEIYFLYYPRPTSLELVHRKWGDTE